MDLEAAEKAIEGKRILIVDDERDVLDTLTELLRMCKIDVAQSFEEAKRLLETSTYDLAILDIMGVSGHELIPIATGRKVPALMLTAHALSEKDLRRSAEEGASYYAPKEEISDIALFIADVLEATAQKKNPWIGWFQRLGGFYEKKFVGTSWRKKEKEFLRKIGIPRDLL